MSSQQKETQRVLVISDGGLSAPAMNMAVQNIHTVLEEGLPYHIEYYSESLDYSLFPDEASQKRFRESYVRKYQDRPPNLIITVGQASLRSMTEAHREFFPNVPVVYCCTSPQLYDLPSLDSSFTGTRVTYDAAKTIDAAIQLRPNTRQVFVVGGTSPLDRRGEAMVKESLRVYESKLQMTYLVDLDVHTLTEKLKHLPSDSVVLFVFFLQDAAGRHFNGNRETVHLVAEAADVPVFVLSDAFIGYGAAGGFVASYSEQGKIAAQMAMQILQGKQPQATLSTNTYMFDWRVLKRWGIEESGLPAGSIVLNRQPTAWEAYKAYILAGIVLTLVEALLILGLLWQRARRRKVESDLTFTNDRLRSAMQSGKAVGWEWNLKTGQDSWFGDLKTMFGITSESYVGRPEDFYRYVHPEHRQQVSEAVSNARKNHESYAEEFRVLWPDGTVRWVSAKGHFRYSPKDEADRMLGMAVDITDRKQLEAELHASEQRWAGIVASAMDAIIAVDDSQRIVLFNAAAEKMFGCQARDAVGSQIDRFIPQRFRAVHSAHVRQFGATGNSGRSMGALGALWAMRANGSEFPIEASISHINAAGNKLFTVIIRDITERKTAEEALRKSEEMFSKAFRQSPMAIALTSAADDRYIDVNEAFEQTTGWRRVEIVGRTPSDIGLWVDPLESGEVVRRGKSQGGHRLLERPLRIRDGTIRTALVGAEMIELHGEPCVLAVANDITEQKLAEKAMRESEERFRLVANTAPMLIWMSDAHRLCTYFNGSWLAFTGRPIEMELGNGWAEGVHTDDLQRCLDTYTRAFDAREKFTMEYRLRHHDGQYRWVMDTGVPRFNDDGSFAGYIGSCVEITDRKLAEEALSSVSRRLIEAQERERTRIARELHDDIGQRLALLIVELEQLRRNAPELSSEVYGGIGELQMQTSEIAKDVQGISHNLHSSKLEYLGMAVAMRGFCREFAEKQNVEIHFAHDDIPSSVPTEISLCLFRVLQEAVQNAVKHGGVRHLDVELRYASSVIDLSVRDSGTGFEVGQAMNTRGLGLVSMAERVKLVNGQLSIDSKPQRGTTIHARVALSKTARAST